MRTIIFKRQYVFPIPSRALKNDTLIIKPIDRIRRGLKKTTMRSQKFNSGIYRIMFDFKPTYFEGFVLSLTNPRRIKVESITDQQIRFDLGLTVREVERIEYTKSLFEFFKEGYLANFPSGILTQNFEGSTVYLHDIIPVKWNPSKKLTEYF